MAKDMQIKLPVDVSMSVCVNVIDWWSGCTLPLTQCWIGFSTPVSLNRIKTVKIMNGWIDGWMNSILNLFTYLTELQAESCKHHNSVRLTHNPVMRSLINVAGFLRYKTCYCGMLSSYHVHELRMASAVAGLIFGGEKQTNHSQSSVICWKN